MLSVADTGTWLDPVQRTKIAIEVGAIVSLTVLNIRGVKESVQAILPMFLLFVVTHAIALGVAIFGAPRRHRHGRVAARGSNFHGTLGALGVMGTLALFVRAYSLGGGTYTGIEAVSNGVQIMREPKVRTAKRTMVLMAISLAHHRGRHHPRVSPRRRDPAGRSDADDELRCCSIASPTRLAPRAASTSATWFVMLALASEAGLLFIAAQAGFVDGPRVMANMAVDSWLPHRFSALSERLSMRNGVVLMGRRVGRGAPLHARRRRQARRHVLDQRVPHVLALEPRHEPVLGEAPQGAQGLVAARADPHRSRSRCASRSSSSRASRSSPRAAGSRSSSRARSSRSASGSGAITGASSTGIRRLDVELPDPLQGPRRT